ncbi:TetR/AcrR family transcriptional regulator [Methylophilus sp. 5]|uniref:TetR/AcrR family transcriptional regulator n=1 Tax=Methylophilus sp. 5 TaxID=1112274 RepID=UPI001E3CDFD4|nr:TetR/AcrR family transcriptional regulator [Methylophilus sp. 5]
MTISTTPHPQAAIQLKAKVGRPKSGTAQERHIHLLEQALELFMTEGVARTSIARIASSCGVSTRTIYERFSNKDELLIAALKHMVEQDVLAMVRTDHLPDQSLAQVLTHISRLILNKVLDPRMVSFFRIGVSEVSHLPELARAVKSVGPERIHQVLADIFRGYASKGELPAANFLRAAESYCELLIAGPRNKALFGVLDADWDAEAHIAFVVQLFLKGLQGMEDK